MMRHILLLLVSVFALSSTAQAAVISGSVDSSTGGGIYATGSWDNGGATLGYTITDLGDKWKYEYSFDVIQKELSHIIFQVSDSFTAANVLVGTTSGWTLGDWGSQGNSNPGIPSNLFGLKFDGDFSLNNLFTIFSDRAPMWGDFYAKGGVERIGRNNVDVLAYNSGFSVTNFDNYVFQPGKIPVPDTRTTTTVPEPASLALLGAGLVGMTMFGRKKQQVS